MANYKKPGRPPKKREWKQEQRFNWTIDFFKFPAVHTFIHQNGIEAVLPEFERLLHGSANVAANIETHVLLLNAKTEDSFGQMPGIHKIALSPAAALLHHDVPKAIHIENAHLPALSKNEPPLAAEMAMPAQDIAHAPAPQASMPMPKRKSILDD